MNPNMSLVTASLCGILYKTPDQHAGYEEVALDVQDTQAVDSSRHKTQVADVMLQGLVQQNKVAQVMAIRSQSATMQ